MFLWNFQDDQDICLTDPFHEPLLAVRRPPHAGRKLGGEVDPFFVPAGHQ